MRIGMKTNRIMCGLIPFRIYADAPIIPRLSRQYPMIIPRTSSMGV
jgi:hypothetical protein